MIVFDEDKLINPKYVETIRLEKSELYEVHLRMLNERGASRSFNIESDARDFMEYCAKEVDRVNGIITEIHSINEENIC